MKITYEGKEIGNITTNRSMTIEEALDLIGVDINEMDNGDPKWDINQFAMDYDN
jgi:hypothetical protein